MRYCYWTLLLAILPIAAIGCGNSDKAAQNAPAATADGEETTGAASTEPAETGPSEPAGAVHAFLEAVRTGDDRKADSMLTDVARAKTAEMNMVVAPPGSDTAQFEVGAVEFLPDQRASVACTWTDRDDNGRPRTDAITWVLREEADGWRIGGMIATMFPDRPPTFLNFEDPEDMLRQQQSLQQEMQRRAEEARSQAQRPDSPAQGEDPIRR